MKNYLDLLGTIMEKGKDRTGRNGLTRALFSQQLRFDLEKGFPAVTTKTLYFKSVVAELLWFLEGCTDDARLQEILGAKKTIWTANANADYWVDRGLKKSHGDLGRVYGAQWREWRGPDGKTIDQITKLVDGLKKDPSSRYHVVQAWNPGELDQMALPPCHMLFQCFVADGKLSLSMIQRSCDMFLGVPFNIASYALLVHILARVSGLVVGELTILFQDAHIYKEHFEAVSMQRKRTPYPLPYLWLNPRKTTLGSITMGDVRLERYRCHQPIKATMVL